MPLLVYPLLGIIVQKLMIQAVKPGPEIFHICFESQASADRLMNIVNHGDSLIKRSAGIDGSATREEPIGDSGALEKQLEFKLGVVEDISVEQAVQRGNYDLGIVELPQPAPSRFKIFHVQDSQFSRKALREIGRRLRLANDNQIKDAFRFLKLRDPAMATYVQSEVTRVDGNAVNPLLTFIPLMLVLMTVTGAVYPAIDLTAGERERGTIEILVAAPVSRMMLLFGKFVAVLCVAMLTALANMVAMVVTIYALGLDAAIFGESGIAISSLLLIMCLLLVLAAFFSATLLCLTSVARSFKEAQAYLIPLMMIAFAPGLLSLAPNLKTSAILSVIPLANVVMVGRDLLSNSANPAHVLIALISTLFYCFLALSLAARIFGADTLLSGNGGGGWRGFFTSSQDSQQFVPTVGQAITFLAILFPFFVVVAGLIGNLAGKLELNLNVRLILNAGVTLVSFVLLPLLFVMFNRLSTPFSFHLHKTGLLGFIGAALLGVSVWTWAYELEVLSLSSERAEEMIEFFSSLKIGFNEIPLPVKLFCLALVPAICEEFTFRGLFLSAFRSRFSAVASVVATAVLFGLFHVFVRDNLFLERFIPSTLMGLLLGTVCLTTRSIYPGMLLHALHNGLMLSLSHYEQSLADMGFGLQEQSHLPMTWMLIALVSIAIGALLLYFSSRRPKIKTAAQD